MLLRVGFVVLAVATGGIALLGYLVAWAALPTTDGGSPLLRVRLRPRDRLHVAAGVGALTLSALLAFRQLGVWWSDAIAWPLALAAFGAALLWARSRERDERPRRGSSPAALASSRFAELYSGVFGVLLVVGAALLFLSSNDVLGGLRDAALTTIVTLVAVGLILAPFLWRLGRNLARERTERIRSEERAELAAHLHDSVLQTLTLMQKRAEDPREVAALARRQERELREWLADDRRRADDVGLAGSLRAAAEEVEDDHRVAIEVVTVGDCELDPRAEAVLGATREALLNAAKHAPEAGPIRLYAEIEEGQIEVFVRDRGGGFEPDRVAADRRGVRESIIGRMTRAGGRAEVRSTVGAGTEVSLTVARDSPAAVEERR